MVVNVVEGMLPGNRQHTSERTAHENPQEPAPDLPVVYRTSEGAVMSPRARKAYTFLRTSLRGGPALVNVLVFGGPGKAERVGEAGANKV